MRRPKVKSKKQPTKPMVIVSPSLDSSLFRWFSERGFLLDASECHIELKKPLVGIHEANKFLETTIKDKEYADINYDALFELILKKRERCYFPLNAEIHQNVAYYMPFHLSSEWAQDAKLNRRWGIFINIRSFLDYYEVLVKEKSLLWIDGGLLAHIVFFKVFNEQYFHHLIESMATTLEILLATLGSNEPLYKNYFLNSFNENKKEIDSVATSYAMRALKFVNDANHIYKNEVIKILRRSRNGGDGKYAADLNSLLLQLLDVNLQDKKIPLDFITRQVMPRGHSAFKNKKEIPAWFVGDVCDLRDFLQLIPNPSETIIRLFWERDATNIDKEVLKRKYFNNIMR